MNDHVANNKVCCFTSANYAYLSRARLLASTFRKHNPDIDFILLLNDVKPCNYEMDMANEPFTAVIQVDQLGIPDFLNWSFKHNVVELCTAVKASGAKYLFNTYEKVIYLDPDVAVFNKLNNIVNLLDENDIVLTPHQLMPCVNREMEIHDIELCSLRHGVFNLGFFAVANRDQGKQFVEWWESRLLRYCYEDIPAGIFTDQKWCDMAPAYFSRLHVLRDFGCNVASWNLGERVLEFGRDNVVVVNGTDTLKFYHFTKYGGLGDLMTKRYARSQVVFEVWYWYGRQLKTFEYNSPRSGYFYDTYYDGRKITLEDRVSFRLRYRPGLENPYANSPAN